MFEKIKQQIDDRFTEVIPDPDVLDIKTPFPFIATTIGGRRGLRAWNYFMKKITECPEIE